MTQHEDDTINRHIDIPTVYLQFKTVRKNSVNNDTNITNIDIVNLPITLQSTSRTHHYYNSNDTLIPNNNVESSMTTHPSTTSDNTSTCKEPIRRSQRIATTGNLNIHILEISYFLKKARNTESKAQQKHISIRRTFININMS